MGGKLKQEEKKDAKEKNSSEKISLYRESAASSFRILHFVYFLSIKTTYQATGDKELPRD
ncbi:hypothetical protein T07_12086 [Trichinella nelsoni]|uniref:Uncharacterized protein n=1 Tax=Trichinella nelsoni TaxID=6336 RepID=A0A0V0RYI0_9BILA|nr:hypothetical protein T07_12086 [Trichinella nelsoni]